MYTDRHTKGLAQLSSGGGASEEGGTVDYNRQTLDLNMLFENAFNFERGGIYLDVKVRAWRRGSWQG